MDNPVSLEYKTLISNSNAYFDIQEACNIINGIEYKDIFEDRSYNGFLNIDRYKAKLDSLTSLLRIDVKYQQEGYFSLGDSLLEDLISLKSNFVKSDGSIKHIHFKLEKANGGQHLDINQSHFKEFIEAAHESLINLLNESEEEKTKEIKFKSLFSGRNTEYDFLFVYSALRDLKIVNNQGVSLLKTRGKAILWAFIDILHEKRIITRKAENIIMSDFWEYLNGSGLSPKKPHREGKSFEEIKRNVKSYFANHYNPPN